MLFHRELMDERERAAAGREIGVALSRSYEWPESAAVAAPRLEAALAARPDDVGRGSAKASRWPGWAVIKSRRPPSGSPDREPNRESALADAADFADAGGRHAEAIAYWRRAIAIDPWRAEYHGRLAYAMFQAGDWLEAATECRTAIRLNPAELLRGSF